MSDSYIKLPAEQVLLMCHKTIEWVHERRKEKKEKRIKQWMDQEANQKVSWWKSKLKIHTYEELEKTYNENSNDFFQVEYSESCSGWATLEVAERLAKLARYGDPVNVSGEDLSYLVEL